MENIRKNASHLIEVIKSVYPNTIQYTLILILISVLSLTTLPYLRMEEMEQVIKREKYESECGKKQRIKKDNHEFE